MNTLTLEKMLNKLALGELSGSSAVCDVTQGTLEEKYIPTVVSYLNDGLLELHSKFILRRKQVIILPAQGRDMYHICSDNAIKGDIAAISSEKYIIDSDENPFIDDLITVIDVFDQTGCEICMDDREDPKSIHTVDYDTLQINTCWAGQLLPVIYQAMHEELSHSTLDQRIRLMPFLRRALENYVAYRLFSSMNGAENLGKSQDAFARYESICNEAETKDLIRETFISTSTKLDMRQFEALYSEQSSISNPTLG